MRPLLSAALLIVLGLGAAAAGDALEREVQRVQEAIGKLAKQRDDDIARERAKSVAALTGIAKTQMRSGDMPGAKDAWKGVLSLDRGHEEARKFFAAINQLDAVLKELDAENSQLLPGQERKPPEADAVVLTVPGKPGSALIPGGPFAAGTVIEVQYVEGAWSCGDGDPASPDDPACPPVDRIKLHPKASSYRNDAGLGYVPAGTAAKPFRFTIDGAQPQLYLAIDACALAAIKGSGSVSYRVRVLAPANEAVKSKP